MPPCDALKCRAMNRNTAQSTSAWERLAAWRQAYLGRPAWVVLAFSMVLALIWFAMLIPMQRDISFPEGALAMRALDAAQGRPVYQDWHNWPHAFAPYGPLTYYLPGWLLKFSPGAPGIAGAYLVGRLLSYLSIVLMVGGVCWAVFRAGAGWWWGVPALALAMRWQAVWEYCTSFRPDAPRTLLTLLAVGCVTGREPTRRRIALALGLLWISFWLKPTAFGVLLALLLWLWRARGLRLAALAATAFGGAGLGLFALLDWHWRGLLKLNMVDSLRNGLDLGYLRNYVGGMTRPVDFLMPLASLLALLYAVRCRRDATLQPLLPLLLAVPLSYANALAQGLKVGADRNYFLEPLVLAAVFGGWWLARQWRATDGLQDARRTPWREVLLLGCALPWAVWDTVQQAQFFKEQVRVMRPQWQPLAITQAVASLPGPILSSNSWLCVAPHDTATVIDYFQYRNLVQRGLLDQRPLKERLARQAFSAVILTDVNHDRPAALQQWNGLFGPGFFDALNETYAERDRIVAFYIWLPRTR
jgi:hypothetical protein